MNEFKKFCKWFVNGVKDYQINVIATLLLIAVVLGFYVLLWGI